MIKNGWYYCDKCGKKAFPVKPTTEIRELPFKCKNQRCPQREQIISIKSNT